MNNRAAYLFSDISFGMTLLSACRTLLSNDTTDNAGW